MWPKQPMSDRSWCNCQPHAQVTEGNKVKLVWLNVFNAVVPDEAPTETKIQEVGEEGDYTSILSPLKWLLHYDGQRWEPFQCFINCERQSRKGSVHKLHRKLVCEPVEFSLYLYFVWNKFWLKPNYSIWRVWRAESNRIEVFCLPT